jgi:hypothetical protein
VFSVRIIIAMMMVAISASETSVNFYDTTRHNIPECSHIHARRRVNLKSDLYNWLIGILSTLYHVNLNFLAVI